MSPGHAASHGHRRRGGDEQGAILILVLVILIVLGVLVGALAGLATPSFSHAAVVRNLNDTVTAANSGVEYGVQYLKVNSGQCPGDSDGAGGGDISIPATLKASLNNRTVKLSCISVAPATNGISYIALTATAQISSTGVIESRAVLAINDSTGSPTVESWRTCRSGEC